MMVVGKRCQEPFSGGRLTSGYIDGGKRFLTPFSDPAATAGTLNTFTGGGWWFEEGSYSNLLKFATAVHRGWGFQPQRTWNGGWKPP
jgi:hypothetical protein